MKHNNALYSLQKTIKRLLLCSSAVTFITALIVPPQSSFACSRIVYETGNNTYITGRSMGWYDETAQTDLWIFPRNLHRTGGIGNNPLKWTTRYGSVTASFYNAGTVDGINEKGLVANFLYLVESDYGDPAQTQKPTVSIGAWMQYFLDMYATVQEAVDAMATPPFTVIAPILPNGRHSNMHIAISDPSGDSAIFEYINGELVIYHNADYKVMTNSPTYDKQLAINNYWSSIGGSKFLPGTIRPEDRFVRLGYFLKSSPKYTNTKKAVASVLSQLRAIGVPLGMADPKKPNIAMTLWRSVADQNDLIYYFESTYTPGILIWADLKKIDFSESAGSRKFSIATDMIATGDISNEFKPATPFAWLR